MKHSPADDRGATRLRASRQVGRRADQGVRRRRSSQATSRRGGTTRPRAAPDCPGPSRIRLGMGFARNAEESGRVGAYVADGHVPVAEQVAADRRLVAAVVVPLGLMGLSCPVPDDAESARVGPSLLRPASVTAVHNLITALSRSGTSDASCQMASVSSDRSAQSTSAGERPRVIRRPVRLAHWDHPPHGPRPRVQRDRTVPTLPD
jgi:hypothetical protein